MRSKLLPLALLIVFPLAGHAQDDFQALHAFGAGQDGAGVWDSVTIDASGDIFGTTSGRGVYGGGIAFRLTLGSNGHWIETVLHNFGSGSDGAGPLGGLVLNAGNLYGTTQTAGKYHRGVAFRLAPGEGHWKETVLYDFCKKPDCEDGGDPWGSLIMDGKGGLFGTGFVAFELSPSLTRWSEETLHDFTGNNGDGYLPQAGPIRDAAGNLYGTLYTAAAAQSVTTVAARCGNWSLRQARRFLAGRGGQKSSCIPSASPRAMEDFPALGSSPWTAKGVSMARQKAAGPVGRGLCSS